MAGKGMGLPRGSARFEAVQDGEEYLSDSEGGTAAPLYGINRVANGKSTPFSKKDAGGKGRYGSSSRAREDAAELTRETRGMKKGGKVSSASSRGDGIARKGKTKGRMI